MAGQKRKEESRRGRESSLGVDRRQLLVLHAKKKKKVVVERRFLKRREGNCMKRLRQEEEKNGKRPLQWMEAIANCPEMTFILGR